MIVFCSFVAFERQHNRTNLESKLKSCCARSEVSHTKQRKESKWNLRRNPPQTRLPPGRGADTKRQDHKTSATCGVVILHRVGEWPAKNTPAQDSRSGIVFVLLVVSSSASARRKSLAGVSWCLFCAKMRAHSRGRESRSATANIQLSASSSWPGPLESIEPELVSDNQPAARRAA